MEGLLNLSTTLDQKPFYPPSVKTFIISYTEVCAQKSRHILLLLLRLKESSVKEIYHLREHVTRNMFLSLFRIVSQTSISCNCWARKPDQHILQLLGGNRSHITIGLLDWAKSHNIIRFFLQAYTSHVVQLIDV